FSQVFSSCKTIEDFQTYITQPLINKLIRKTTTSKVEVLNWDNIGNGKGRAFISNHRDIILDAGFLNVLLHENDMDTTEIAIGDNLLAFPWISALARLNKSFIVKRNVSFRQMLNTSTHLSKYIIDTIENRDQSVWIAQREGRAKDSNDRTQTSLLKMLTLFDSANPKDGLMKLNITPLSISYELDPCDYLKAIEYQLRRDDANFKKSPGDDIKSMVTGITGYKGHVVFRFGKSINNQIDKIPSTTERSTLFSVVAEMIDKEIFENYSFFPFNYVAYDQMTGDNRFAEHYTEEEKQKFYTYINTQLDKINIKNKDIPFLRTKLIEMYGNTLKNYVDNQQ
ncbi:MAG: 1-acyl-sn-glycerol-3-phosphate acyltransferase, partial [Dysgonamonadaceae bacterium]